MGQRGSCAAAPAAELAAAANPSCANSASNVQARLADGAVRRWLKGTTGQDMDALLLGAEGSRRPALALDVSLAAAMAEGAALANEQQSVMDIRLSREYMKGLQEDIEQADVRAERWKENAQADAARRLAAAEASEAVRRTAADAVRLQAEAARAEREAAAAEDRLRRGVTLEEEEEEEEEVEEPAPPPTASGLPGILPDELAAALRDRSRRVVALDVRSAREAEWGRIKNSAAAPFVVVSGSQLAPTTARSPDFLAAARAALGPPDSAAHAVLFGPGTDLDASTKEAFVSKEKFVSIAPSGTGVIDGEVSRLRCWSALLGCGCRRIAGAGGHSPPPSADLPTWPPNTPCPRCIAGHCGGRGARAAGGRLHAAVGACGRLQRVGSRVPSRRAAAGARRFPRQELGRPRVVDGVQVRAGSGGAGAVWAWACVSGAATSCMRLQLLCSALSSLFLPSCAAAEGPAQPDGRCTARIFLASSVKY